MSVGLRRVNVGLHREMCHGALLLWKTGGFVGMHLDHVSSAFQVRLCRDPLVEFFDAAGMHSEGLCAGYRAVGLSLHQISQEAGSVLTLCALLARFQLIDIAPGQPRVPHLGEAMTHTTCIILPFHRRWSCINT